LLIRFLRVARKTLLRKLASERGLEEFRRRRGMTIAEENR